MIVSNCRLQTLIDEKYATFTNYRLIRGNLGNKGNRGVESLGYLKGSIQTQ